MFDDGSFCCRTLYLRSQNVRKYYRVPVLLYADPLLFGTQYNWNTASKQFSSLRSSSKPSFAGSSIPQACTVYVLLYYELRTTNVLELQILQCSGQYHRVPGTTVSYNMPWNLKSRQFGRFVISFVSTGSTVNSMRYSYLICVLMKPISKQSGANWWTKLIMSGSEDAPEHHQTKCSEDIAGPKDDQHLH